MSSNPYQPPQTKLDAEPETPPQPKVTPREGPAVYQPFSRGLIVAIVVAICVWAGYLAVGSWLGGDAKFQLGANFWRGVIVVACFALFLIFWGVLLRTRKPKQAKYRQSK